MSYYQSNYGGGGGYANSGPPPPPCGGYGGYGGGQQQQWSAYNVNQYPSYGGYQTGSAPPPGYGGYGGGYQQPSGAVPGFTVPAVQQIQQHSYNHPQPCAAVMQMPVSLSMNSYDQHLYQYQMHCQQQMQQQAMQQAQQTYSEGRDTDDGPPAAEPKVDDEEIKARLKKIFVDELARRQAVSGTFDMTEGTVKGLVKYGPEDPVVAFYKNFDGEDKTDQLWDAEADCCYIKNAMDGAGTNEDAITHVVATRSNAQRQQLKQKYKTAFGKDLIDSLKSELGGDYKEAIMACFVKPAIYDAWCVKEAIYGPGTDEKTLIEIFMTRTNAQIKELRAVYPEVASPSRKAGQSLIEKDIEDDTSGDFKRLLYSACQGDRSEIALDSLENSVDETVANGQGTGLYEVNYNKLCDLDKAKRDATNLFKAGEDRWGTDEATFTRIFATRDYYQLRETWKQYTKLTQRDILNSVDRETSGDYKDGLRAVVMNVRCRPRYFAERLQKAMKGLGTDDRSLIRIIVSRSEIDMVQIKQWFLEITKQTLWRWLKDDCSGDYKKLLQALVGKD